MKEKLSIFRELWLYARTRKRYWLLPIFIFLVLISFLISLAEIPFLAPFIYPLF